MVMRWGGSLFSEVLWEGILSVCWFPTHGRLAEQGCYIEHELQRLYGGQPN